MYKEKIKIVEITDSLAYKKLVYVAVSHCNA